MVRLTLLLMVLCGTAYAQPVPVPDTSISVSKASNERLMKLFKVATKTSLRAKLMREKRRVFRRDETKIEALELAIESDELLEIELRELVEKYQAARGVRANELGDGELLRDILDWLGSEDFQNFLDALIPFIEKLIEIIGGLASIHSGGLDV